jgi:hypothetical protein
MSLGLFNCRLIQPAGDQLFFLSAVWRHPRQFGQALSSLLETRPPWPRPAGGRRMLLVFPSQKDLALVFTGGEAQGEASSLPIDSAMEPENPTASGPSESPNWPYIIHLASCPSRNSPTDSSDKSSYLTAKRLSGCGWTRNGAMPYPAAAARFTALLSQCRLGILLRSLRLPTGARIAYRPICCGEACVQPSVFEVSNWPI